MDFNELVTEPVDSEPAEAMQVLLRNILVRANFVPAIRHTIGWRGIKNLSAHTEAWTAKIKGHKGVYGLFYISVEQDRDWTKGHFALNYFPDPDEELVDHYSVHAGLITGDGLYMEMVRDFIHHEHFCDLFNIGIIDLSVNMKARSISLTLNSVSEQRIISQKGVFLMKDGINTEVVSPGGIDASLPAYEVSFDFFEVLASSLSLNYGEAPSYMRYVRYQGYERSYDESGLSASRPAQGIFGLCLDLCYGSAQPPELMDLYTGNPIVPVEEIIWPGDGAKPVYDSALWWKAHVTGDMKSLDKSFLGIDERPRLILLTGFLGSGKTSFLQHFIEYQVQMNRFVAIIQNEIGEEGIDAKLLDHDYSVIEVDEGCVCCTLVGNLKIAIEQIMESFHPDYIVVETTGLANPLNITDELVAIEELTRFDSITTVVDGENIIDSLHEYRVAVDQISAADIILLNKVDLLTGQQLDQVQEKIRTLNVYAPIFTITRGDINPALLFDVDEQDKPGLSKSNSHDHGKDHHDHRSDGLSSLKVDLHYPVDKDAFIKSIEALKGKVFRIKGVVEFADDPTLWLFQYVSGRYELSHYPKDECEGKFLIFIGRDIESLDDMTEFINVLSVPPLSN